MIYLVGQLVAAGDVGHAPPASAQATHPPTHPPTHTHTNCIRMDVCLFRFLSPRAPPGRRARRLCAGNEDARTQCTLSLRPYCSG